jgi:hypothetical protein
MKIVVPPRNRRLLVLCACSAAAHFALLELLASHGAGPYTSAPAPSATDLSVRLAPPVATHAATSRPAARSVAAPPPAAPTLARALRSAPKVQSAPAAPAALSSAPGGAAVEPADTSGPPLTQMPGRYRVRLPAPALLTYDVVRQPAGGTPAPAGAAHLSWRTDGDRYVLDMDGPLGRLHSEGASGDAGIAPAIAQEEADGGPLVTEFDAPGHRVLFRAGGTEGPDNVGIQDRASVLMQLAGIGLAEPDQVRDVIEIVVAGVRDLRIARFRVLGQEAVATGTGTVTAWHLAELAAPGMARLDVWIAPEQGWMPVRLRLDDGSASVTQTLSAIGPAAGPPWNP